MAMSNPNVPIANVTNITVPNINMLTRHGAECNNVPKYKVMKFEGVDVKPRTLSTVPNRQMDRTNILPNLFFIMTV
jgi:hypothetical protein